MGEHTVQFHKTDSVNENLVNIELLSCFVLFILLLWVWRLTRDNNKDIYIQRKLER